MDDLVALARRQDAEMVEQGRHGDFGRTPSPRVGSMPQNTPSAPPLTSATPGRAALMRVPKLPVPPIMNGSALIAARMRPAASACLFDRRDGSAMLAMARARLLSGVASVGMPQPSVP